jgi:PAS domain S-box-containing protein
LWSRLPFIGRLLVTTGVALLIAGLALLYSMAREQAGHAAEAMKHSEKHMLELLPALVGDWIVIGDYAVVKQSLDRFTQADEVTSIEFVSTSGARVLSQDETETLRAPVWFRNWVNVNDRRGQAAVMVGGRGYGTITLSLSAVPAVNSLWDDMLEHLSVLVGMLMIDFFGIWLVLRNALAPLKLLEAGVKELASGASSTRVNEEGSPELRRVIRSFNQMSLGLAAAHAETQVSEKRLRTIFQMASDGIHILDDRACLLEASDSFFSMLGYERTELLGADLTAWDAGSDANDMQRKLAAFSEKPELFKLERRHRCKDGQVLEVEITGFPLALEGRQVMFCSSRDITERKRNEQELALHRRSLEEQVRERTVQLDDARVRAEAASHAKSTFLANMSHEIRTPLNAVLGFTNLLLHQNPSPEQHKKLTQISASAHHLLLVLKDVLDLSKIEAGHMILEEERFEIRQVVDQLRSMLEQRLQAKRLEFIVDVSRLPEQLDGDATRLMQALLNYVGNAVKFTAAGSIVLRGDIVTENEDDILIRFEVEDTGIGIPADKIDRIFAAFEQADGSITRQYGGTGLGLAINLRLAQLMGGEVGVCSVPGKGSTFWITARFHKREHDVLRELPSMGSVEEVVRVLRDHCGAYRLLLVEDDPINRMVALEMLSVMAGLQVDTASDGDEALHMAGEASYDLILMDIQMPKLDGLSATRLLREMKSYADTPIIAMTANAFSEDRAACYSAGMNDYIAKPFDPDSLFRPVAKWLVQVRNSSAIQPDTLSDVGRLTVVMSDLAAGTL